MGRDWDSFDGARAFQEWNRDWASAAKRLLKPGGHLLAFGSDDGHHRTACGIEDAGFEIRTHINWIYGSGFPKALDVSKAIDKQADAERETVGEYIAPDGNTRCNDVGITGGDYASESEYGDETKKQTAPATDAAEKWDGWKTALKPATEFVVLARKPLSEGTVAENVQEWGTGALNIDGTRIDTDENLSGSRSGFGEGNVFGDNDGDYVGNDEAKGTEGRYPSNVVFDEQAAERLDREVEELESGRLTAEMNNNADSDPFETTHGEFERKGQQKDYPSSSGGPSRYFKTVTQDSPKRYKYTSKASKAERTLDGRIENAHPTVKPQDLMEWLVKLATAEGQIVLGTRSVRRWRWFG